jgi:hypothetical protein
MKCNPHPLRHFEIFGRDNVIDFTCALNFGEAQLKFPEHAALDPLALCASCGCGSSDPVNVRPTQPPV